MMSVSNPLPSRIPSQVAFSGKASKKRAENPGESGPEVSTQNPVKPSLWQRVFHHRAAKATAAAVGIGGAALAGGCAGGYIYVEKDPYYCPPRRGPVVIYQDPPPVYCPPPVFIEPNCPPRYHHYWSQPPRVFIPNQPSGGIYWQHHDE